MAAMHADGIRSFDFSVGTYDYKRRFGVRDRPLVDVTAAVSWRGRLAMAAETMFRSVRRRADTLLKRG
jgi:CelD/BcsL family acetyltransferase involved in cellulose biosynthesis